MNESKQPQLSPPRHRRWLIGGLTLLILSLVVIAAYRWKAGEKPAQPELLRSQAIRIVPGIYLLGGLEPAAAYVVETADGLVLIDSGLHADLVKREMIALKLDWRRVRAILLTHVHADHCGGAQERRAATGAKIYAGRGDAAILRAGRPREAFFSTFPMPDPTPAPTTVDVALDGDQTFMIGDVRFTALATPGHTPGSVCYLLERGEQRALFSGDIIWSLSDESNPLGSYVAYLSPRYRGDAAAFLTTLRRLRAMPVPHLILPGHPRNDPTPQSPTITQQRWETLLDKGIRDMELLQARYAGDGADFLDGEAKKLLPDLYYLGDFDGVAVYGFFAAEKFFLVNAPGKTGLSAFVNAAMSKLKLKPAAPTAVLVTAADEQVSAGIAELVERCHPRIVAPSADWEQIKKTCPAEINLLAPEDLAKKKWFEVTPIALEGRGVAPMAYLLPWRNKSVLFSGTIPIKIGQSSIQALSRDFQQGQGDIRRYRAAIERLREIKPDLWLPALPSNGQNANLYNDEWKGILNRNDKMFP